ncbi:MAG: thymidine phosphorylase [Chthonomonadetes bacterium]|nr:thymidine phosphorylase [Chthonomonadetes bacterium]
MLRVPEIIQKKRDGGDLSREELETLVLGGLRGEVPDYQVAAWLMAVYFRGMTPQETLTLTSVLQYSGQQLELPPLGKPVLDKHSTGGVGDKTSLVVVPLLAALGIAVPKMSGRGLGFTGGTVDKLESIPGFRTDFTPSEIARLVERVGACLVGQSPDLVPADKYLYALRDVTATVDCIPLIAASVMSKKLAGGAEHILLDVKTGSGAFMQYLPDALDLARTLVQIGQMAGRRTLALVTDMSQPLGEAVGNALEVAEAIRVLRRESDASSARFETLCLELSAHALLLTRVETDLMQARMRVRECLDSGKPLEVFRAIVEAQGGDPRVIDDLSLLPQAPVKMPVFLSEVGYIHAIDARQVGLIAVRLGAGRARKDDAIDPAVGVRILRHVGDHVDASTPVAEVHARPEEMAQEACEELIGCFHAGEGAPAFQPLVHAVVSDPETPDLKGVLA